MYSQGAEVHNTSVELTNDRHDRIDQVVWLEVARLVHAA